MRTLKRTIARKAARAAVRHTAHGVAAKAQRRPLRSASLLSVGALVGCAAGWLAARRIAGRFTAPARL
jgi:hypothetical protein